MYRKSLSAIDCSTARALDQVGEWWSLMIVRECTLGTTRFDEFQRRLDIARNVLTSRLNHLVEQDILEKRPAGGRYEYHLTPKGEALYPVLVALMQWGDRWASEEGRGGPLKLVEHDSGKPLDYMGPRAEGGPLLGYRDIRMEPQPWASEVTRERIQRRNSRVLGEAGAED